MDGFQIRNQGLGGVFFDFRKNVDVRLDGQLVLKFEGTREGCQY